MVNLKVLLLVQIPAGPLEEKYPDYLSVSLSLSFVFGLVIEQNYKYAYYGIHIISKQQQ